MNQPYKLYSYWRSSASWRVRWTMHLKKIPFECIYVNLLKADNQKDDYLKVNPSGLLPLLQSPEGKSLGQSMAIIEYLDAIYPSPQLLGKTQWERAKILEFAETINADTSPLQTPRAQKQHSSDEAKKKLWAQHFIRWGLNVCSKLTPQGNSTFVFGEAPTVADIFLIPQVYNAIRYEISVEKEFPRLFDIYTNAMATNECKAASPASQQDAQP